jgi:hypothetical protein
MKKFSVAAIAALAILMSVISCKHSVNDLTEPAQQKAGLSDKPTVKTKMDMPVLSCAGGTQGSINLQVCAGATGAPAGFSIQWMLRSDFIANGSVWPADETTLCKASFSGNANDSRYNLAPNACVTVSVGDLLFDNGTSATCTDELFCGTAYVFRAFAHANSELKRSDFTATSQCTTMPCRSAEGCTYSQGYWKTHGPEGCNPASSGNLWPLTSMTLGTVVYSDAQLCSIMQTPAAGNGLITLAHQLIAAKMNIANGSDPTSIAATIASADALIGNLAIPPVGAGFVAPANTAAMTSALDNYNLGATGPGHCQ